MVHTEEVLKASMGPVNTLLHHMKFSFSSAAKGAGVVPQMI